MRTILRRTNITTIICLIMMGLFSLEISALSITDVLVENQIDDNLQKNDNLTYQNLTTTTLTKNIEKVKKDFKKVNLQAETSFVSSGYTSSLPGSNALNSSYLLKQSLTYQVESAKWKNKVDGHFGRYLNWQTSVYALPEFYSTYVFSENSQFSFGRKIFSWNQIDSNWNDGIWQPIYKLDALRPIREGQTGFFFNYKTSDFELLSYLSPVFIPTMTPDIIEENGSLVSYDRWYQAPAKTTYAIGKETEISYSLDSVDYNKLVFNPAIGLNLKWGNQERGFVYSLSAAKKPINTLLIQYDANLYASTSNVIGKAVVGPVVGYHSIFGADMGFNLEDSHISISYTEDFPDKIKIEQSELEDKVQQQPGKIKMLGLHFDSDYNFIAIKNPIKLTFDYLKAVEDKTLDIDADGFERGSIIPYRLQYTNALSVGAVIKSSIFSKSSVSSYKILRDFEQSGYVFCVALNSALSQKWIISAGVDILAVDDSEESNLSERFINKFRANDRVYGGVSYVF